MQGIANQSVMNSQNHQILGWQVADTKQGKESNQTGTPQEGPAYIISISTHEIVHTNSEEISQQYNKDTGRERADRMKACVADCIESEIKTMLDPLAKLRNPEFAQAVNESLVDYPETKVFLDPKYYFREAAFNLRDSLDTYAYWCANDDGCYKNSPEDKYYKKVPNDGYYKKLTGTLDTIDPEHKNSVVNYIRGLIGKSATGQKHIVFDEDQSAMNQACDDLYGHLSIDSVIEKGDKKRKAFDDSFGEPSEGKFWARGLKATPTVTAGKTDLKNEIVSELIKTLDASTEEDTSKTSTSEMGMLVNQRTSQVSNASNKHSKSSDYDESKLSTL